MNLLFCVMDTGLVLRLLDINILFILSERDMYALNVILKRCSMFMNMFMHVYDW